MGDHAAVLADCLHRHTTAITRHQGVHLRLGDAQPCMVRRTHDSLTTTGGMTGPAAIEGRAELSDEFGNSLWPSAAQHSVHDC